MYQQLFNFRYNVPTIVQFSVQCTNICSIFGTMYQHLFNWLTICTILNFSNFFPNSINLAHSELKRFSVIMCLQISSLTEYLVTKGNHNALFCELISRSSSHLDTCNQRHLKAHSIYLKTAGKPYVYLHSLRVQNNHQIGQRPEFLQNLLCQNIQTWVTEL